MVADGGPLDGRVLLVQSNAEAYGSDRSLAMLARRLIERGWKVEVALPGEGPTVTGLRASGATIHCVDPAPFRRSQGLCWVRYLLADLPVAVWRIRRLARQADVVHVNTSVSLGGVLGGFAAGRPVVLHLRESYAGRERLFRAYARLLRPMVAAVVAISSDIAAEATGAGLGDRTVLIHNGLELSTRPPAMPSSDGPLVMVGRINDWKGQVELVSALALLRDRGLSVPLRIAGDAFPGAEVHEARLRAAIHSHGLSDQVTLLGFVDDVDELLASSSIFVMPSTRPEPFGLALVEAMAQGLACIATDAGGPRDIIRDDVTGRLVPCGDVTALAKAIEELWTAPDTRRRLGREAALEVRQRFSIETTAERVAALYEQVRGCGRPH